jgi:hypothetical protein
MIFNPEMIAGIPEELRSNEGRESAHQKLADLMAIIVGAGGENSFNINESKLREKIEETIALFSAQERCNIIAELRAVTKDVGWQTAHDILAGELDLAKEIEGTVEQRERVKIYGHTVRRPEDIKSFEDFISDKGGPPQYWIPRKYDIQRYIKSAVEAHERSGKSGTIKVLDIGGGSGFLGKLIADEAKNQGLDLEVTVMDPDAETLTKAREVFSDTRNLKFETGTSNQALSMFGPELTAIERDKFDELENKRLELLEVGKEELSYIKAMLVGLEAEDDEEVAGPDILALLSGAFGNRARTILEQSGIALDQLPPFEQIRDTVADFYRLRWEFHQREVLSIRDEQEKIYAQKELAQAKVDMVLNSWMPLGLDFTREMRMLNAPAIVFASHSGEATGIKYVSENPVNLGKVRSYDTGNNYKYISEWQGVATTEVSRYKYGYPGSANVSEIHFHKGVGILAEELDIPDPSEAEGYAWEKSLIDQIGIERIRKRHFS